MSRFLRPSRRQKHRYSAYWLGAFGGIFLLVSLGFLVLGVVPTVIDAMRMRQWEPVPAQLLEVRLASSRNSSGNTTTRVQARYRYVVAGRTYTGERVAVSSMADNLGDFWYQLGWQLKRAHQQGNPVPAWVNPSDPTKAVLDRSLRRPLLGFWAIFIVVFGGTGVGMLAGARHSSRQAAKLDRPLVNSQPWMAYPAWAGPSIASNMRAERWVFTVMGLVFLVFGASVSMMALPQAVNGRPIVWVVLLFPLVGLVMCWHAIKRWRQHRRYGAAALVLAPHPAPLGGRVVIHLDLPVQAGPQARVVVALSCLERSTRGSGDDQSTSESLQWENEGVAKLLPAPGGGTRIQWQTDLPGHLPASAPPGEDGTVWRVSVTGQGLNGDFSAHYDIPVFATGARSTFSVPDDRFTFGQVDLASKEPVLRERIAAVCRVGLDMQGGLVLDQPYARMRRVQMPWLIVGVVFLASGIYLWRKDALGGWMGILFGGLGMLALVLSLWHLGNRRKVTLDRSQGATVQRWLVGIPVGLRRYAQMIERLSLYRSYGLQVSGQRPENIWQVRAHLLGGKAFVLADSISGEDAARLLMNDIARHTGWPAGT